MATVEAQTGPPGHLAGTMAAALAQAAAHQAFELFKDKAFQRLAGFDGMDQTERDRIFNELVVAHLVLSMLILEAPDLRVSTEFRDHLVEVKTLVPKAYVDNLRNLGVKKEHCRVWEKLLTLRYEEYAKDRHGVRSAAMQLEGAKKPLDLEDLSRIQLFVPVQAAAIGCHDHVCRGKTDGRDELFKTTLKALARFYGDIRIRFEGGKITIWMRARRLWRRLFGGSE